MIDSPRKAFGNNASDRQRAEQIYSRFRTLADAYGDRLQLIIADNDTPPIMSDSFGKVEFDSGNPMVPGVEHAGRNKSVVPKTNTVLDTGQHDLLVRGAGGRAVPA
ncbi:hypothetical protein ACIA6D_02365 [Streptomyces cacaoi]